MLLELQRYYGPLRNSAVIHNGRDPERCLGMQPTGLVKQSAQKEPLILCAGRLWDQGKNVEALAAVAQRVEWPVCVAGSDTAPSGGSATLVGLRALGPLEPQVLAQWYARASIYALPARYEPFGLTALEAALCGCALVLGDIPSLREVWADAALYVAPDDHDALRETLNALVKNASLRAKFAAQALARANELSPERFVNGYRAIYRQLNKLPPDRAATRSLPAHPPGVRGSAAHPT
jgi:glycosyltransferase involved in cell wall biosynthesis